MEDEEELYTHPDKVFGTKKDGVTYSPPPKEGFIERLKRLGIKWQLGLWYWSTRKNIGSKIIGNPSRGKGILLQIPLNHMTDFQKEAFFQSRRNQSQAGITCDSGMSCNGPLDLEYDWSLRGCYAICKRCGYDSRDNVRELILKHRKEHREYLDGKNSGHAQAEVCKSGKCKCFNNSDRLENGY